MYQSKENNKTIRIFLILLSIMTFLFVLFIYKTSSDNRINTMKFNNISEDGSFVVVDNKIQKDFSDEKNVKIEWYTDLLCPDCERAHRGLKDFLSNAINKKEVEIKFYPLNYLPQHSDNDYPLNSASWILGIAEYSPEETMLFIDTLFADRTDLLDRDAQYFYNTAISIGVKKENVRKIEDSMFTLKAIVNNNSVGIRQRKDLLALSPTKDRMFVPFIIINQEKSLIGESKEIEKDLIAPIKESIKNKETMKDKITIITLVL